MSNTAMKNESTSVDVYEELLSVYGPMMDLTDLAMALRRSRNGIRTAIAMADSGGTNDADLSWAKKLASIRSIVGRKALFPTRGVADLIEQGKA